MGTKPRFLVCELVLATKNRGFVFTSVKKSSLLIVFKVNEIYFGNKGANDPGV